jgi:RimJ/RimL family protein N-acetyltransferase
MTEELVTDRLVLRELTSEDAAVLFAYRSHPSVSAHQGWAPESLDDAHEFIAALKLQPPYTGGTWRQLGIVLRSDGRLIGDCGIHVLKSDSRHAEIGYTIAPEFHRQGYGTESVRAILGLLFGTLRMRQVVARTLARNAASRALLAKVGFVAEKRGRFVLSAEDWKA